MKIIICLTLIIFFFSDVMALEKMTFFNQYPSQNEFQKILLSKLKSYFEALSTQSLSRIDSKSELRVFQIKRKDSSGVDTIYAKIERGQINGALVERINYYLENGRGISFIFKRFGIDSKPSTDKDLLELNFKLTSSVEEYSLEIPIFGLKIRSEFENGIDTASILLKPMGPELKIENIFEASKAERRYYIFFKDAIPPQTSLVVKAEEISGEWAYFKYSHFSSTEGEITPNLFFQKLEFASTIYEEFGKEYLEILKYIGFPKVLD